MMGLADPHGDPQLTEGEEALLVRLFDLAGTVDQGEYDAWFGRDAIVSWPLGSRSRVREILARREADEERERRVAIAITKLSPDERRMLHAFVVRHPHTYVAGLHESIHLRHACELAALRVGAGTS